MRRIALAVSVMLASIALSGAGVMQQHYATFTPEQRASLGRISVYLNAIKTLKGGFEQIDPNGAVEEGQFYIVKPGRMRFEYQPPDPLLIVSDGNTVAVKNAKLKTVDRYPLTDTPLDLILGDQVDLNHNLAITGMAEETGTLIIHARSQSSHAQGDISIAFSLQPLELRQWTIVDAQGLATTIALKDLQTGVAIPDDLFVLRDTKNAFTRKGQE